MTRSLSSSRWIPSRRAIHDSIVARGPKASVLGPPAVVGAEDCMVLSGLPESLSDLHYGMPPAIQQAPMRLLKIKCVLDWKLLKVYEEVDAETECLQAPYKETDDDLWKRVVTISWRWAEQKPPTYLKEFSPMSEAQFIELSTLLQFSEEKGIDFVWIDWSCVPQYAEDSMVEVHRSKVFYARSRAMCVLPTFRQLPAEGPVRLILVRACMVLTKRSGAGSVRCATAAAIIAAILEKNLVAGREYFGRVWTLAERMARFGRNEGLCQWLSLESWLGMVVDAMLKSSEDKMSSVIYRKMLGQKAAGFLDAVLAPLSAAVRVGSVQTRAAEGLETKVAELCMAAVKVWLSPSLLAEAPTSNWLHTYLGEEARLGVYQAWCEADRVWAIYSYFCWKQNLDQRSAEGLRIALDDLVEIASGDRSVYVKGMFAQLGVDENATSVMEILPQPVKQATAPARLASSRSTPIRPPSARPPSARTQEEIERQKKEEKAAVAAREQRWQEEEALVASQERRRHEEELAGDAASEQRKQEEMATLAATACRELEEEEEEAAVEWGNLEEAAPTVEVERKKQEDAAAAAAAERKEFEEAAEANSGGKVGVGSKVTIKYVSVDEAKVAQAGHGGWAAPMETMLGTTGLVTSINKDGDINVKMDDGGETKLWSPSMVVTGTAVVTMTPPSALSATRIGTNAALNDKYTVRFIANSSHVGAVQADLPAPRSSLVYYFEITVVDSGSKGAIGLGFAPSSHTLSRHVGWDAGTFGFHGDDGKTYFESRGDAYDFKYSKGDVVGAALDFQRKEIFFTKNGTKGKALPITINNILYPTVSLNSSGEVVSVNFGQKAFSFNIAPYKIKVGDKVAMKGTSVEVAKAAQSGHGGWGSSREKMLGKTGVVESIDTEGDVRVKMDDGSGAMLWNPALVTPEAVAAPAAAADPTPTGKVAVDNATALHLACENGHLDVVRDLIAAGAPINAIRFGATPLYLVAERGFVDCMQLLLEAKADMELANNNGATPLHISALENHQDCVKLLLKAGANKNVTSKDGCTPLHTASGKGHVEVIKLLVEAGVDRDIPDEDGDTPLFLAAGKGQVEAVQYLLSVGVDKDKADKEGSTPLHISALYNHQDCVELLLKAGANKNATHEGGYTPLHLASLVGHVDVIKVLVEAGSDKDIPSKYGETSLFLAAGKGHVEAVKYLLSVGANKDLADEYGRTPKTVAKDGSGIKALL